MRTLAVDEGTKMPRAALVLAIGIVLGAAVAVYFETPRSRLANIDVREAAPRTVSTASSTPTPRAEPDANVVDALAVRPRSTAERAAFYAAVARADARGIETLLIAARSLSDRETRAFALDVLLARYAELDPSEAVAAAKELEVPAASLVPLYHAWLESSQSAALASLGTIGDPKKMEVVTSLLALVSDDDQLVAQISALLPPQASKALYASALGQLARTSPAEALARVRKIPDAAQRKEAMNRVLSMWATSDPRAVADYLGGLDDEARSQAARSGVWDQIAIAAPELALERAGALPEDVRAAAQAYAIQALSQRDPKAALAQFAQMPRDVARRADMLPMIARSYATRDAEGALAWARSLQPPEPGVMAAVISSLAEKDPARAFDLATEITSPMEQLQALQSVVNAAVLRDPASMGPMLERVLAMPNSAQRQALEQTAIGNLASSDPGKAAEWLIANPGQSSDIVMQVASAFGRTDPARAASYSSRLTGDARVAWLRGVATSYAQVDSPGAIDWVDQLRGTPEYDDAAFAVAQSAATQDPAGTSRLIDSISREDYRRSGTLSLAMRWTNTDPAAAANWAANLHDPAVRTIAVQAVGSAWAQQNAPAAKEWVLSQPPGAARDGALQSILTTTARFGAPDASLLAEISTDQGRLAAVQTTAMTMAQRDTEGARAFVESNVANAQDRERIQAFVSQFAARRNGGAVSPIAGAMYPAGALPTVAFPPGAIGPRPGVTQAIVNGGSVQTSPPSAVPCRPAVERCR
jgi:hypothetical protein